MLVQGSCRTGYCFVAWPRLPFARQPATRLLSCWLSCVNSCTPCHKSARSSNVGSNRLWQPVATSALPDSPVCKDHRMGDLTQQHKPPAAPHPRQSHISHLKCRNLKLHAAASSAARASQHTFLAASQPIRLLQPHAGWPQRLLAPYRPACEGASLANTLRTSQYVGRSASLNTGRLPTGASSLSAAGPSTKPAAAGSREGRTASSSSSMSGTLERNSLSADVELQQHPAPSEAHACHSLACPAVKPCCRGDSGLVCSMHSQSVRPQHVQGRIVW